MKKYAEILINNPLLPGSAVMSYSCGEMIRRGILLY
jgi:hypothetical protein